MRIGNTVIVSEVNLGTTIYGCYVETINGSTYSYFRNRFVENNTGVDIYTGSLINWDSPFWSGVGPNIWRAYIPYYGVNGKALNGVCFKKGGLDSTNQNQAFNWRAPLPVGGSETYNNARVFNFQRGPTHLFAPLYNDRTSTSPTTHHIQLTDTKLIIDNDEYVFQNCEPCVICYVIKSSDTTVDNSGVKLNFKEDPEKSDNYSNLQSGLSYRDWYESGGAWGTDRQYSSLILHGNDSGHSKIKNNKVYMYKIKANADFNFTAYTQWEQNSNVTAITQSDPLYPLYADIIGSKKDTKAFSFSNDDGWLDSRRHGRDIGQPGQLGEVMYVSDLFLAESITNHGNTVNPWRGRLTLYVDTELPTIGPYELTLNPGMSYNCTWTVDPRNQWLQIWAQITDDRPGIWPHSKYLNFLDTSDEVLGPNGPTEYTTYTSVKNSHHYAMCGFWTNTGEDSCYVVLCCWECPNTSL